MRVDSHHHFWQMGKYDYDWMGAEPSVLKQDYGPDELKPLLDRNGIDRTVLVQTVSSVDETRWFCSLADEHPFIAGVIGWLDLIDPSVGDVLDDLAAHPKLVGIRHVVHDEPDDNWLLRDDVQAGLGELAKRPITYDLLIRPPHLAPSLETVRKFPELTFIVDHIAKPVIAKRGWDDWAGGIAELAKCPNVACKLSGMITEADWANWTPDDLSPYVKYVIECFGTDRVMYGSDWPVCLLAGSYDRVVEALAVNVDQLSESEQQAVWGGNATRRYRLED